METTPSISGVLPELLARDVEHAWDAFLGEFAPLILQVVRLFERDQDEIADCFLFVCEKLKQNRLRKIRRFDSRGPASFPTWLRAVVRNLCLDWRRKRFGRPRILRSIARLPELDQAVFQSIYQRRMSENEAFHALKALYPSLERGQLADSVIRIESNLSPRQSWLMATRHPRMQSLSGSGAGSDEPRRESDPPDPAADPERDAAGREALTALRKAVERLPEHLRLLLRMRFEQELSLKQIARLTGLGSPVRVQRTLQRTLAGLESELRMIGPDSMSVQDDQGG